MVMGDWKPEKIPNSWSYWEKLDERSYPDISQLLGVLSEFGSNSDFLIDGVDFVTYCSYESRNKKESRVEWGRSLETVSKYLALNSGISDSGDNPQIEHKIYDCPYTGTPEKKHFFKMEGQDGKGIRLSFVYGPSSEAERKLFWDEPKKSYQESNSDKD